MAIGSFLRFATFAGKDFFESFLASAQPEKREQA